MDTPAEREIRIGAPVYASDGRVGIVERVVLDPTTREATELVVALEEPGKPNVMVPIGKVERATKNSVAVQGTRKDVSEMTPYIEMAYMTPSAPWLAPPGYAKAEILFKRGAGAIKNLPPGAVEIAEGAAVCCTDGVLGVVKQIDLDQNTGEIISLVIRVTQVRPGKWVDVPGFWVQSVAPESVSLSVDCADVLELYPDPLQPRRHS